MNVFLKLLLLVVCVAVGFQLFFMNREKFNYLRRFYFTACYFFFVSVLVAYLFREDLQVLFGLRTNFPLIVLAIAYTINFAIYIFCRIFLKKPQIVLTYKNSHTQFLEMDFRYLIAKTGDIVFQQLCIALSVLLLVKLKLTLLSITILFVVLFTVAHVLYFHNLYKKKQIPLILVYFFTIFSFIGALYMPSLILLVPYGLVYSFILHTFYYSFLALFVWIYLGQWKNNHVSS